MSKDYFAYRDNFADHADARSRMVFSGSSSEPVRFTIAIPTYRRPQLLETALISSLNQTEVDDYEVLVVDNDHTDAATRQVVERHFGPRLRFYRNEENIGMFGNWNRCIELARGEYITVLSDDDWLSTQYLATCLRYLGPYVDGLYFPPHIVDCRPSTQSTRARHPALLKRLVKALGREKRRLGLFDFFAGNPSAGTLGVLMRTSRLRQLGGYNPGYYPSSDYILHANYCYRYTVYYVNRKMNYYRIDQNESAKQETLQKWVDVDFEFREYLARLMGRGGSLYKYMNTLIQENRVEGLRRLWHFEASRVYRRSIPARLLELMLLAKRQLNI